MYVLKFSLDEKQILIMVKSNLSDFFFMVSEPHMF